MGDRACFLVHRSVGRRILSKVAHPLSRLRSALTGTLVLFLSAFLLTACILTADQSIEGNPQDPRAQDIADKIRSMDLSPRQTTDVANSGIRQQSGSKPSIYLADGTRPQGAALIEQGRDVLERCHSDLDRCTEHDFRGADRCGIRRVGDG